MYEAAATVRFASRQAQIVEASAPSHMNVVVGKHTAPLQTMVLVTSIIAPTMLERH